MKEPETYWTQSRSEFWASIEKVLNLARHQIWLYDSSFDDWPLESVSCNNAMRDALLRMKASAIELTPLIILLKDIDWIEKHGARLLALRSRYPSLFDIRLIPQSFHASECIAIVDQQHAVIRPHKDSYRAKTVIALPSEVENRQSKLRQLREISSPCLPTTTLGL
jgi:hypothetical protein